MHSAKSLKNRRIHFLTVLPISASRLTAVKRWAQAFFGSAKIGERRGKRYGASDNKGAQTISVWRIPCRRRGKKQGANDKVGAHSF